MKYKIGQTVILLNTEFKPVGSAIILDLNQEFQQYEVEYQISENKIKEKVWVKQERLTIA
jgi:hypothetical protein